MAIYDIPSPSIPTAEHITDLVQRVAQHIPPERLWINPGCGLKTRQGSAVLLALANMVAAANSLRTSTR